MNHTPLMRLADLKEIGANSVSQLLADMDTVGAGSVAITVSDGDDNVVGGLVCLSGPHAQRYMDAIESVTQEIEQEDTTDRSPS